MKSVYNEEYIRSLKEWDKRYVWHPFTPMAEYAKEDPLVVARGEGPYLYDVEGNRYIDGHSSLWVNVHGHCREEINRAIIEQLGRLEHSTLLGLANVPSVELAKKLVEITPSGLEKVFFSDNGSTAVEAGLKIAYQYHRQRKDNPGDRKLFVTVGEAYHGDTVGSVSLGHIALFHRVYGDLLFETLTIPTPYTYRSESGDPETCKSESLSALEKIVSERGDEIAGVVMEPLVQGAGGIIVHPEGFLREVRRITEKNDILLIADEVAVGFGRTGRMFACEHEGVEPDIMAVAKSMTAGYLPVAATLVTDRIYEAFLGPREAGRTFFHGHTYTGNPLGCAAALASLELFEKDRVLEKMAEKEGILVRGLDDIASQPYVGEVRRRGFMVGIELVRDKKTKELFDPSTAVGHMVTKEARKLGAIIRPLGNVIVLMPPLTIPGDALEKLLDIAGGSIKIATGKAAES